MSDTPPDGPRIEMRVVKPVNLRSEPSTKASTRGLLAQGAIVWKDGEEGEWIEAWVHGWVHRDYVQEIG